MEGENINTRTKMTSTCKLRSGMGRLLLWVAMAVPALLASCSQDELEGGGTALPEGKYPLAFTAGVGEMQTRAVAGKDVWKENDAIGVRMGSDTETAKYELKPDGGTWTARPADAANTLYWQSTAPAGITAWYPYGEQSNVNISDQSKGFAGFDFLRAEASASYNTPLALTFRHQMAKVTCVLTNDAGLSPDEWKSVGVAYYGAISATFTDGELKNGSDEMGWITPQADTQADTEAGNTHVALLVPQKLDGKTSFIRVTATVGDTKRDFYYTPTGNAAKIEGGIAYTYNISVRRDGISVKQVTGGTWENGGETQVTSVILKTDLSTAKVGDFLTSDGKLIELPEGMTLPNDLKQKVIGIVFHVGRNKYDNSVYTSPLTTDGLTLADNTVHGYVVALTDATDSYCMWGTFGNELKLYPKGANNKPQNNFYTPGIDWDGYKYTQEIIKAAGGISGLKANKEEGYPATYYAVVDYASNKVTAPTNSSGWFLPSIGQMWEVYLQRGNLRFTDAGGSNLQRNYLSSSEYYRYPSLRVLRMDNIKGRVYYTSKDDDTLCYVRAVLAF